MYANLLKRRVSLILKQLFVSLPLMSAIMIAVVCVLIASFSDRYQTQSFDHIGQAVQIIAQTIDTARLDRIQRQEDFMDADYQAIRNGLHQALNQNRDHRGTANSTLRSTVSKTAKSTPPCTSTTASVSISPYSYLNDPNNLYWKAAPRKDFDQHRLRRVGDLGSTASDRFTTARSGFRSP